MALQPPNPNVEHPPKGPITDAHHRELGRKAQELQDFICQQFPVGKALLRNEIITVDKIVKEAVTAEKIKAGTITTGLLEAESITTELLHAEAVTAAKIKANTIEAGQIKAETITANKLSITELSAITSNIGEIKSGTIIGTTIKTAKEGARVEITSGGIKGINASAKEKFNFDTTTGILTATAVIEAESGSKIPTEYLTGSITETQIGSEAISTPKLKANAVTASKISVENLAAIKADLGSITAGTITGALIRTSSEEETRLNSEGLRILASAAGVNKRRLSFVSSTNSKLVGVVGMTTDGVEENIAAMVLEAKSAKETHSAKFTLSGSESAESSSTAISATVEGTQKTILDGLGQSAFLQLTSAAKRKINFGKKEFSFSASKETAEQTVEHGLGVTPESVQLTVQNRSAAVAAGLSPVLTATPSSTVFKFKVSCQESTSINVTVYWVAIG